MASRLDALPAELKLAILSFLDVEPPSSQIHSHIFSDDVGRRDQKPLKNVSTVSKSWRVLTKSILFSHVIVHIPETVVPPDDHRSPSTRFRQALQCGTTRMKVLFDHSDICCMIESFTVNVHESIVQDGEGLRDPLQHSSDFLTMNIFWRCIFDSCNPSRLNIIAPVTVLGWLTLIEVRSLDAWAFPEMAVQMLQLEQEPSRGTQVNDCFQSAAVAQTWDTELLFQVRPWKSLRLNEGSMLKAYEQYEYFHKVPPSILNGVLACRSATIDTLYIDTIFPFFAHLWILFSRFLKEYKHIYLQFTPRKEDRMLDDPLRVGKANLADCWNEVEEIYDLVFDTHGPLCNGRSRLRSFYSGDYGIESIRDLLDKGFARLASRGWRMTSPGKWELAEAPET